MFSIKKSLSVLLFAFLFTGMISSCKKDETPAPDPTAGLTKQAQGYVAGAATKLELYTKEPAIYAGYTKFYIALYDSATGSRVEEAHIHLTPMMDMGMMQHSAPFENPASMYAVDHLFPCATVFIMPSTGGSWTLEIEVHNHATDKEGSVTIPLTVVAPAKERTRSFIAAHDGGKYFISLIGPVAPKVGINDMEFVLYKKASMMNFPADSSLSVVLTPEMPTMGHGSPNNVNPVHTGNGHYKGKVNFTMTGLWKLNLDFSAGAAVADSTQYFEIEF